MALDEFISRHRAEEAVNFGSLVRVNMPVYKAPPELKAQIQASLRKESGSQLEWVSHFRRLGRRPDRSFSESACGGDLYQHKDQFINVFVWPAASGAIDFDVQSHQGDSLCGWDKSGLDYLIISALSEADMEKLEDLLREQTD